MAKLTQVHEYKLEINGDTIVVTTTNAIEFDAFEILAVAHSVMRSGGSRIQLATKLRTHAECLIADLTPGGRGA